jgi:phosphomannomutase
MEINAATVARKEAGELQLLDPWSYQTVSVLRPAGLEEAGGVWDAVKESEAALGESGRVLLRPSGTEPVVRVMVEAPTSEQAHAVASDHARRREPRRAARYRSRDTRSITPRATTSNSPSAARC